MFNIRHNFLIGVQIVVMPALWQYVIKNVIDIMAGTYEITETTSTPISGLDRRSDSLA